MRSLTVLSLLVALVAIQPTFAQGPDSKGGDKPEEAKPEVVDVEAVIEGLKSKKSSDRLDAATQALTVEDDEVTRPLTKLLRDDELGIRAAAIRALGKRSTKKGKRDAAKALEARMPKLAKEEDGDRELLIVIEALGELAQPSSIKPLLSDIENTVTNREFTARMNAVANIPDAEAVDELIQFLASRGRGRWAGRKQMVVKALQTATGEKLGNDPDNWRAWWKDHKKSFDFDAAAERRAEERAEQERRAEKKRERKNREDSKRQPDQDPAAN